MNDGSDQGRRYPAALERGYFDVDETSFEQLLAMSAGLGERLRFYGSDNVWQPGRTWSELFHCDETLVMAEIAAFDLARYLPSHDELESVLPEFAANRILMLALTVNHWLARLQVFESPAARAMHEFSRRLVAQHLAREFNGVVAWRREAWSGAVMRSVERLNAAWNVPAAGGSDPPSFFEALRTCVQAFRTGITRLSMAAREQMTRSLQYATHDPSAGLLLAFMQLYQTVQQQINTFTDRHIDFYYNDILRMRPRPAVADHAHLVYGTSLAVPEVLVPAGTPFSAGKDLDGRPLVYRTDEEAAMNGARVAALYTVLLDRNPRISPEVELGFVTHIKTACLPLADAAVADAAPPHWPLFGGRARQGGPGQAEDARIGLAIASPILLMAEGERELNITLRLVFADENDADAAALFGQFMSSAPEQADVAMHRLLERYFALDPSLLEGPEQEDGDVRKALLTDLAARLRSRLRDTQVDAAACARLFLTELLLGSQTPSAFAARFGKLAGRWLLGDAGSMSFRERRRLCRLWHQHGRDTIDEVHKRIRHRHGSNSAPGVIREMLFSELFAGIFDVSLSTAEGWHDATDVVVTRGGRDGETVPGSLRLSVKLQPKEPPVVACSAAHAAAFHGVELPTSSAVVLLRLRSESRVCPYSLLADSMLSEITLGVEVRGLRNLALSNQLGRLDSSKPFNPFGPLPVRGSYLVFGAAELAAKNLTQVALNLEWGGLPEGEGGFERYYEGYESRYDNRVFTTAISLLRDGQWHPRDELLHSQALFNSGAGDRLRRHSTLRLDSNILLNEYRASTQPVPVDQFMFGPAAGDGFFKLQLTGPAYAFGHQEYPGLLTKVLTSNARLKRSKQPLPIPNAPYTPVLERITLDYSAESTIVLGRSSLAEASVGAEKVFVLHPFGVEQIHPAPIDSSRWLLPRFACDGNLYIGLAAAGALSGRLSLHFHLRDESALPRDASTPVLQWDCLSGNRWHRMAPERVLSDTTRGFLTSGIVALDIPDGVRNNNTVMPAGLFWLRLSTARGFQSFATLYAVRAQAQRVTLADVGSVRSTRLVLPAGSIKEPAVPVPGLLSVQQIGPSFGRRAVETPRELRTRTSERLGHKNRCTTPWDYEHLVLQEFPEVCKVKCFPHLSTEQPHVAMPGRVLLVVIPSFSAVGEEARTPTPRMNVDQLERIARFVRAHASPFVKLEVCNAAYERIQVRCSVRLKRDHPTGLTLKRINQAIVQFLSPWEEGGLGVHFDWTLAPMDVEGRLRKIEAVESVAKLSILQVAMENDTRYMLGDSARPRSAGHRGDGEIRALVPWSIAVPMAQHLVDAGDAVAGALPEASGVRILELGNTFVVGEAPPAHSGASTEVRHV